MVDKYLRPAVGHVPVTEIKPMLMKGVLDPIAKQGKIETVKRICIIANEIMRIAVVNGAIEFNPLVELTKLYPSQKVKHNPALTPEELPFAFLIPPLVLIFIPQSLLLPFQTSLPFPFAFSFIFVSFPYPFILILHFQPFQKSPLPFPFILPFSFPSTPTSRPSLSPFQASSSLRYIFPFPFPIFSLSLLFYSAFPPSSKPILSPFPSCPPPLCPIFSSILSSLFFPISSSFLSYLSTVLKVLPSFPSPSLSQQGVDLFLKVTESNFSTTSPAASVPSSGAPQTCSIFITQ